MQCDMTVIHGMNFKKPITTDFEEYGEARVKISLQQEVTI